jgi:hypothetical protein
MRAGTLVALLTAPLLAPSASGETRPLLTEEATTAVAGTLVLESGAEFIAAEPNFLTGRERNRWAFPLLRVVYSPAANVEMDLEWVGRVGAIHDPDFGSVSDSGDVTLRAKIRFRDGGERRATIGARFAVSLPETKASEGLGPNALRVSAQMLLTRPLGRASLHLNAGLAIQDKPLSAHEQRDFVAYGVAVTSRVAPRIEAVGELAGLSGAESPGADQHAELRFGLRYSRGPVRWDAALRRGLTDADGTWGVTAGLAWTIRPSRGPRPSERRAPAPVG